MQRVSCKLVGHGAGAMCALPHVFFLGITRCHQTGYFTFDSQKSTAGTALSIHTAVKTRRRESTVVSAGRIG